jgi:hypothetical protein
MVGLTSHTPLPTPAPGSSLSRLCIRPMFPESSFLGTYKPKYKYTPKVGRLILPASHFLVHHHLEIAILETKRSYKITSNPFDEGNGLDIGVSQMIPLPRFTISYQRNIYTKIEVLLSQGWSAEATTQTILPSNPETRATLRFTTRSRYRAPLSPRLP